MDAAVKNKVMKIMEMALDINSKQENTIFVDFAGHTETLNFRVHINGWTQGKSSDISKTVNLNGILKNEKGLDEIIEILENMKNNNNFFENREISIA